MTSTNDPIPATGDPAAKPARRTFPAEYKLRIVAEYDAAPAGEKGAILRRERLYHSHVIEWRRARDAGAMATLTDQRTSPARPKPGREAAELARLRAENVRLKKDLATKDAALVVLGKTHALLEMLSESAD
jgi:transposase-like protein